MQLTIKNLNGSTFNIKFTDTTTVEQLKQEVASRQDGVNATDLVLVYSGQPLENANMTLASAGIENNSTVFPIYRLKGGV